MDKFVKILQLFKLKFTSDELNKIHTSYGSKDVGMRKRINLTKLYGIQGIIQIGKLYNKIRMESGSPIEDHNDK